MHAIFYQWDQNQRIILDDECPYPILRVDFSADNDRCREALSVQPYDRNGVLTADVPNRLLQYSGRIQIYLYCEDDGRQFCRRYGMITVLPREKPSDYVYTETELLCYRTLAEKLDALEEGGLSGGTGGTGGTGMSKSAAELLVTLLQSAVYREDISGTLDDFAALLDGETDGGDDTGGDNTGGGSDENVEDVPSVKKGSVSFENGALKTAANSDRALLVPIGQYLEKGKTYKFSLGAIADKYYYGVQIFTAESAGLTFPYADVATTYTGVTERIATSSWTKTDYTYTPDVDNCIFTVNFKENSSSAMNESNYAEIFENFVFEEITSSGGNTDEPIEPDATAYVLHRGGILSEASIGYGTILNVNYRICAVSEQNTPKLPESYNAVLTGKVSNYAPIKVPDGAKSITIVCPELKPAVLLWTTDGTKWTRTVDSGYMTTGGATYTLPENAEYTHYAINFKIADTDMPQDAESKISIKVECGNNEPDVPDVPEGNSFKMGTVMFENEVMILSSHNGRATLVPIGQYLEKGKTYKFSIGDAASTYMYGVQIFKAESAGLTFPYKPENVSYDGVTERLVDSGWMTNDYSYTPDSDNCILAVNFRKKDYTDMGDSDYAAIAENFIFEETVSSGDDNNTNEETVEISAVLVSASVTGSSGTGAELGHISTSRRATLLTTDGDIKLTVPETGETTNYSLIRIPQNTDKCVITGTSVFSYGISVFRSIFDADTYKYRYSQMSDSGWIDLTSNRAEYAILSNYADGNHYIAINFKKDNNGVFEVEDYKDVITAKFSFA